MACIRKRRGKWVVDYRDGAGVRRWLTCETRREAEDVLSEKVRESRQRIRPSVNRHLTVAEYAEKWFRVCSQLLKPRTLDSYTMLLRVHLLPEFGPLRLSHVQRAHVKEFLLRRLESGLSRGSVKLIHAVLRALLASAVSDGLLVGNPAQGLGKELQLSRPADQEHAEVEERAMMREQLRCFLATVVTPHRYDRRYYELFLTLARAGLRLGEALALKWGDLDFYARKIHVRRTVISRRDTGTPKGNRKRVVDMSQELRRALLRLQVRRKTETLKRGWPTPPEWVFCSDEGTRLDRDKVEKAFGRILSRAGLPGHFTPHSLRHTFGSLLIADGASPAYVCQQMGHSSIKITVDIYGSHLPIGSPEIVDRLDDGDQASPGKSGSNTVASVSHPLEVPSGRGLIPDTAAHRASATQTTPARTTLAPASREPSRPSPSQRLPMIAENTMETSRAATT